jgi:pyruvate formate lyase activating enzyme
VPLHFTQFHPAYRMPETPITPVATLERSKAIADAEGLHYVYIGNVPGHLAQNTYCPSCNKLIVERVGFTAGQVRIEKGCCGYCQHPIAGVWQ